MKDCSTCGVPEKERPGNYNCAKCIAKMVKWVNSSTCNPNYNEFRAGWKPIEVCGTCGGTGEVCNRCNRILERCSCYGRDVYFLKPCPTCQKEEKYKCGVCRDAGYITPIPTRQKTPCPFSVCEKCVLHPCKYTNGINHNGLLCKYFVCYPSVICKYCQPQEETLMVPVDVLRKIKDICKKANWCGTCPLNPVKNCIFQRHLPLYWEDEEIAAVVKALNITTQEKEGKDGKV
jgi:hypothetical protein